MSWGQAAGFCPIAWTAVGEDLRGRWGRGAGDASTPSFEVPTCIGSPGMTSVPDQEVGSD